MNPADVKRNQLPPPVVIEEVWVDGQPVFAGGARQSPFRISPGRQQFEFHYTGLSFTAPEKVRFKYRLDGLESKWMDAGTKRTVNYSHIPPGNYTFRVLACNNDGVWNEVGGALAFTVLPHFWQTWWFRISSAMGIGLSILFFYRMRLRRLTRQLNMRFEERLAERTRIAQDLHDTLLQGFLSASMQLDVAADHLPADSPAKPLVNRVLELMRQVIDEGRTALKGLRSSGSGSHDLAETFAGIRQELAIEERIDDPGVRLLESFGRITVKRRNAVPCGEKISDIERGDGGCDPAIQRRRKLQAQDVVRSGDRSRRMHSETGHLASL